MRRTYQHLEAYFLVPGLKSWRFWRRRHGSPAISSADFAQTYHLLPVLSSPWRGKHPSRNRLLDFRDHCGPLDMASRLHHGGYFLHVPARLLDPDDVPVLRQLSNDLQRQIIGGEGRHGVKQDRQWRPVSHSPIKRKQRLRFHLRTIEMRR